MKKFILILLMIALGFVSGCDDDDDPIAYVEIDNYDTILNITNEYGEDITAAPQGYSTGINFSIQNINIDNKSLTIPITDGASFELEVYDSEDNLVRDWIPDDIFYPSYMTEITFEPGEIKEFELTWDQTDNDGTQLPPGTYNVYVNRNWEITPDTLGIWTGPKQIEIYDSIEGTWTWYESSGGIGGTVDTPDTTGETRTVVFDADGSVTFYTNNEITLSSTYTLASEDTIISDVPLPVVRVADINEYFYIYSFPSEDELELQENVTDGYSHSYSKD